MDTNDDIDTLAALAELNQPLPQDNGEPWDGCMVDGDRVTLWDCKCAECLALQRDAR